jgi:hypothetical protein
MNTAIPLGFCQCGCGGRTGISSQDRPKWAEVKGQPRRFLRGHNMPKGGLSIQHGYAYLMMKDHPRSHTTGYVAEHIRIAMEVLGKPLPLQAQVHHVNGIKTDNRNENLVICEDKNYHQLLHVRQRAQLASGNPNYRKCSMCKQWDAPNNLLIRRNGKDIYHKKCKNLYGMENKRKRRLIAKTGIF